MPGSKNARKRICLEERQRLQIALAAVARCAQRYQPLLVVAAVAQRGRVVQLQNVIVCVPKVAALGASVFVFGKDVFAVTGSDLAPLVFTRAIITACVYIDKLSPQYGTL